MPASLQEVKRRIESTKKTSQITSAMQMVSTAKLSQIQKHATSYQVYATKIRSVITHLSKSHLLDSVNTTSKNSDGKVNTLGMLRQRPVKTTGIVVITSDRGLVGSYNSNVIKETLELIENNHHSTEDVSIIAIGGTGADFFKKRGYNVAYEYRGISDIPTYKDARPLVEAIVSMYDKEVYDEKVTIPKVNDIFEPLLAVIPLQMIAYELAKLKGCSVDKPKNLAKSVTVE